ncbi:MAG: type II secretion system major pseudopilin GspG [Gemmatimonadaceae bacterium]|nr:type II secretion system major pseudopilin GspG [Gemmatimonadaceae bacterium]
MTHTRKSRTGFTLVELMVVIVVIGLLAGLVAPQIIGRVGDARVATAKAQVELIGVALENYRLDNGAYPTTNQGLSALRQRPAGFAGAPDWRGPYLKKSIPLDPWRRPYIYRFPDEKDPNGFSLMSLGRDGQPGGAGEDADIGG